MTKANGEFTNSDGIALEKHYDKVIELLKELVIEKINNIMNIIKRNREVAEEARILFKETNDAHLELLNGETARTMQRELEFKDKEKSFVTKSEFQANLDNVQKDVKSLNTFKDTLSGRASSEDVQKAQRIADRAYLIGIAGTLLAIVSIILRIFGL